LRSETVELKQKKRTGIGKKKFVVLFIPFHSKRNAM
jgi:hypothetical protein